MKQTLWMSFSFVLFWSRSSAKVSMMMPKMMFMKMMLITAKQVKSYHQRM